jgi:hypothetical protein
MAEQVQYRAKIVCRVGGFYRRAGDVFTLPKFEATPPFLEEVSAGASAPTETTASERKQAPARRQSARGAGASPPPPGPMPEDFPGVVRDPVGGP